MTHARITNPTSRQASQWVPIVMPSEVLPEGRLEARIEDGRVMATFRVERGGPDSADLGHELVAVEARAVAALSTVDLTFVPQPDQAAEPLPFRLSDWVTDDLEALGVALEIRDEDNMVFIAPAQIVEVWPEPHLARICLHARARVQDFILDFYGKAYHDQDVVDWEATVTFGGAPDELFRHVQEVAISCGEYVHVDLAIMKGVAPPTLDTVAKRWRVCLVADRTFGRAQQVDFQGALLCLPQVAKADAAALAEDTSSRPDLRVATLLARLEAPLLGLAAKTDGGAFRAAPLVPAGAFPAYARVEAETRFEQFKQRIAIPGDVTAGRTQGLNQRPPDQGGQRDFGAYKGWPLHHGHPASLLEARWCCEGWSMRPEHNREPDGSPVLAKNHPLVRQWGHIPDPRQGTADLLGWPATVGGSWPNLGWDAMDDQHYSVNLLCAVYHHTRSPVIEQILHDIMELDKMSVSTSPHGHVLRMGAPRAVGRRLLAWAHIHAVGTAAHRQSAIELIEDLMGDVEHNGELYQLDPSAEIRVLDSRQKKYGWIDPSTNEHIRCWVGWEHAFVATGAMAAGQQVEAADRALAVRLFHLAKAMAETVTHYSFFQDQTGRWRCCYAVRTNLDPTTGEHLGEPLPAALYRPEANSDVNVYDSIFNWTLGAAVVAKLLMPGGPVAARAEEILDAVVGPAGPRTWDESEWLTLSPTWLGR